MRFTSRWNWNLEMLVFYGGRKTGDTEKTSRSKDENQQQLNPHMTPGPGIEPGPHWWRASALTTALTLLPSQQRLNCSSAKSNCSVTYGGKSCMFLSSLMNQSTQIDLNNINVNVFTPQQIPPTEMRWSQKEILFFILCQKAKSINSMNFLRLSVTLQCAGRLVSIVSLCFLLAVYLSYKELRNLPGKCLISLS